MKIHVLHLEFEGCEDCPFCHDNYGGGKFCKYSEEEIDKILYLSEAPDWCSLPIREEEVRLE